MTLSADYFRKCKRLDSQPSRKGSLQRRLREVQARPQLHRFVHVRPQSYLQLSRSRTGIYVPACMVSFPCGYLGCRHNDSLKPLLPSWGTKKGCSGCQSVNTAAGMFLIKVPADPALTLYPLSRYYCTLTIRESILKVNGSRIKGWWRLHHFISTVCAAVLLIWPQGESWQLFRTQFMYFNVYISKLSSPSLMRRATKRVIFNRIP